MPAQNFLPYDSATTNVLFTRFSLKPKEEWSHIVNFLNYFIRTDEKKVKEFTKEIKEDIREKYKEKSDAKELIEAKPEIVKKIESFFQEKFYWEPGEYEITVKVHCSPKKAEMQKKYRFTLFESDSQELKEYSKRYKYGDGILFDSKEMPGIVFTLQEI